MLLPHIQARVPGNMHEYMCITSAQSSTAPACGIFIMAGFIICQSIHEDQGSVLRYCFQKIVRHIRRNFLCLL